MIWDKTTYFGIVGQDYCIFGVDCGVCIFGSFTVAVVLLPEEWLDPPEE